MDSDQDACIIVDGHSMHLWQSPQDARRTFEQLSRSGVPWKRWGINHPYVWPFPDTGAHFEEIWQERFSDGIGLIGVDTGDDDFLASYISLPGPKPRASFFSVGCPIRDWRHHQSNLLALSKAHFSSLACFHGMAHHDAEYRAQNWGEVEIAGQCYPGPMGVGYKECLPGVYWGNLFGPPVTDWIGEDRIRSCPCHEHREFAPGYHWLMAYPDVVSHDSPEAIAAKDAIREHLGVNRFFDRRFPDRELVAPPLDWSELYRPPPQTDSTDKAELKQKAREMGGWLEMRPGEMRLHLDGTPEPEENREE